MDRKYVKKGFSLLEMGITLIILSILIGGALTFVNQNIRIAKTADMKAKLSAIDQALQGYRKKMGRIPCPADATVAVTATSFGVAAANTGTCTGGSPAVNFNDGSNTVGGVVPIRTLGLTDEYMFDSWGGRFTYVVDKRATAASAFTTYPITDTTIGSITVKDESDNNRTAKAVAVIVSHGPNGHGAYQFSGVRKSSGSTNTDEQKNCHCDATAAATAFDSTFYMQSNFIAAGNLLDSFDDTVVYYTRQDIKGASDVLTE